MSLEPPQSRPAIKYRLRWRWARATIKTMCSNEKSLFQRFYWSHPQRQLWSSKSAPPQKCWQTSAIKTINTIIFITVLLCYFHCMLHFSFFLFFLLFCWLVFDIGNDTILWLWPPWASRYMYFHNLCSATVCSAGILHCCVPCGCVSEVCNTLIHLYFCGKMKNRNIKTKMFVSDLFL